MTAKEAREWLEGAGARRNANRFLVKPPMAIERLQNVQVPDLPAIVTAWLTQTGSAGGSPADLRRVWEVSHNFFYPSLRTELRTLFDALVAQAQRREIEMTMALVPEEEKAAAERSRVANKNREKAAIEQAQKDLDQRRAKFDEARSS